MSQTHDAVKINIGSRWSALPVALCPLMVVQMYEKTNECMKCVIVQVVDSTHTHTQHVQFGDDWSGHSSSITVEQSGTNLCPYSDPASPSLSHSALWLKETVLIFPSALSFTRVSCLLSPVCRLASLNSLPPPLITVFFFSPLSGTQGEQQRFGWMSIKTSTTLLCRQREMFPMESKYL